MDFFLSCETPSTARNTAMNSFLFQIPLNGTLHDFKAFQFVSISVSFRDLGVELCTRSTQDLVKFVRRRLFSRHIFQDGGIDTGTSFGGYSFIHCFVKRIERLRIFIHRDRIELLNGFV